MADWSKRPSAEQWIVAGALAIMALALLSACDDFPHDPARTLAEAQPGHLDRPPREVG